MNEQKKKRKEGRLSFMLWSMVSLMVVSPVCREFTHVKIVLDLAFTLVFISGIYAVSHKRILVILQIIFAVPMLLYLWERIFPSLPDLALAGPLSAIIFSIIIIKGIFDRIISAKRISSDLIRGGLVIYLLLGFAWAMLYVVLFNFHPTAFNGIADIPQDEIMSVFLYFSFVTMSTLGYGDISPAIEITRSLAMLEAIAGQIYLVVVVAWLVGVKIAQDLE